MRSSILVAIIYLCLANPLQAKGIAFKIYGDYMQFLPIATLIYALSVKDYYGALDQAIGSGVTALSTFAIKQAFVLISKSHEGVAYISKRPINGSYDGFPSGHTSFAFSSVGFAQKRYGWKASLPLGILATSVGVSRVYAKKHTITQVIVGAAFGFLVSYFLTSRYGDDDKRGSVEFYTQNAKDGSPMYILSYNNKF